MRWIIFLLLASVSICSQPDVYGQNFSSAELKKYPDIAYRERAFQLFRFLVADVRADKRLPSSSPEYPKMYQTIAAIGLELIEAGVFMALDKPLKEERLTRLSPAARAFYDYYRQSLPSNPVFRDVFKAVKESDLNSTYQAYKRQKHPEDEWLAYEVAARVLDPQRKTPSPQPDGRAATASNRPEDRGKPNRVRLLAGGGGILLACAGLTLLAIRLRHRFRKRKGLV